VDLNVEASAMQVACRPLGWYQGGLRDEDLRLAARASLGVSSGGLSSMLDVGLLINARLYV
jgi:hypothetical protein